MSVSKKAKIVMSMYVIFTTLLLNYEEAVHRTILGSSGRDCVSIILFQFYCSNGGFFESNLIWVGQYDPLQPLYWN